ncbi:MAG TPA: HDIG domain-containing protein, partial [Chlamydiales bacterium]|nr:HDIG domain-containing protein [Chlamydiales bacterium]
SFIVRVVIGLTFALVLFFFLHFREVRVDVLELATVSPKYVIAEVNFAFADDEATALLRQEAVHDIGKVFTIDPDTLMKRRSEFQNFLIQDTEWRKVAKESTYDEMHRAIERLCRTLMDARFTDARTIHKMMELGFDTSFVYELSHFDTSQGAYFPDKVWASLKSEVNQGQNFHKESVDYVINYFRSKIWLLKVDGPLVTKLEKAARAEIPTKYTEVMTGTRLIDRGEKVTTRHLAMLQAMKESMTQKRDLLNPRTLAASCALTILFVLISYAFLQTLHPEILNSNKRLFLLVSIVFLGMGFAKATEFLFLRTTENLFEIVHYPLLTPFLAILVTALISPSVALFVVAMMATLYDFVLAIDFHDFMLMNLLVAFFAILFMKSLRKRTEIFAVSIKAWVVASLLIAALHCYDRTRVGAMLQSNMLPDLGGAAAFMVVTAVLVVGFLPLFEACFGILTDITLMEYMDPSHELLRRLMVEAPGTYQHALIMGNIAESAARAIGANGLFCRVATLYHDIGKMAIAQYFTENQQHGVNIHQLLTPVESAEVIISHVTEGVQLARKAHLPEQFIDIIKEHHGTSLVYYFYHKQLELVGGKRELVNEKEFRYSGPKPKTKESVVIMISDSVEAASRSLDEVNESTLVRLIDDIVREKLEDGQFDESHLTFEELGRVKRAIVKSLLSIGHFRVKYPARVKRDASAVEAGRA